MLDLTYICRHWDVTWLDSHRCRCTECGRIGRWYEEGFVVWRKRPRVRPRPRGARVGQAVA